ncbi:hypothetical protein FA95DRAFT_447304 [Auriscalpium vulgare]|uniref:Uncharacterized protein n=1 Tax=Auriscalpium vulgare TaxID=40419 RepID=A0ACB8SAT4_9AGAM|nr:hypothetical protein FA95DRAFT_447304 [Auriscalpium vulgare]
MSRTLPPTRPPPDIPREPESPAHDVQHFDDPLRSSSPVPVASTASEGASEQDDATTLTPIRAHYLKKTLLSLQFNRELTALTTQAANNISTLSYLGPPFHPPPKDAPPIDVPFLRYLFRQFVLTFPFLASAPKDFFPEKVQPFVGSLLSRNLSPTSVLDDEGSDPNGTAKLLVKAERNFALFLNYAVKIVEKEETVRLSQKDLDRLEMMARKRHARLMKHKDVFEVNIVCVRTVVEKGRVRSRVHEEFIIRTRRSRYADVCVSRRYGDFKTLYNELRKAFPDESIRPPPAKDRTTIVSTRSVGLSPTQPRGDGSGRYNSSDSLPLSPTYAASPQTRLAREKNRLTLRAYLHSLMAIPAIASSPVIQSFLLSDPTTLTGEELDDAEHREEADKMREEGRQHFAKEVAERVDRLRDSVKGVKGSIMGKDGLTQLFGIIKTTDNVRSLPPDFQSVLEWARISLASTVFHHFVAADDASESLAGLKRIHGLMPYFMLKTALKISNPVGMIRTVLDLFLAQPFGGRSLLQRMFTSSLQEEVKALEEDIEAVKDKIDDPVMCEKVRIFVYAPQEIQALYKSDAASEKIHVLAAVLRSGEEPALNRAQMQRVVRSHRAHMEYINYRDSLQDSDDDDGPQTEEAWLFEDLSILAKLYGRLRDKEQLIALIFEGVTADILKDIITIFYSPLAQVYRAASIADSIGDLQNFINDLIRTVESTEELSQENPRQTVQIFIDLIQRHEQSFYHFVHKVHSKGEGLFTSLMRWIELFLSVVREGLGEPVSLEFLLPHTGDERKAIVEEVDAVALYHYKLKVAYESKLRRRFGTSTSAQDMGAEEETAQAIVTGFVHDFSFGDIMRDDAQDVAAQDEEDEDEDEDEDDDSYGSSSEYESATDDESSEGTESSEGHTPSAAQPYTPSRSRTAPAPSPRPPRTPVTPVAPPTPSRPDPPSPTPSQKKRPRLLSLRRSRSLIDAKSPRSSTDAPPVPPLPPLPKTAVGSREKALPPRPPPQRRETSDELKQKRYVGHDIPLSPKPKKKGAVDALKYPELSHMPHLLPVFIEMVRNLRSL